MRTIHNVPPTDFLQKKQQDHDLAVVLLFQANPYLLLRRSALAASTAASAASAAAALALELGLKSSDSATSCEEKYYSKYDQHNRISQYRCHIAPPD
jgi:hypothetical protein